MKIYTTAPMEDPRDARTTFAHLEEIGYDGASLTHNRAPDPSQWADVVAELKKRRR